MSTDYWCFNFASDSFKYLLAIIVSEESALKIAADWSASLGKHFRANITIWKIYKHYSTLEVHKIPANALGR